MRQFVVYGEKLLDKCTGTCGWSFKKYDVGQKKLLSQQNKFHGVGKK
jgi:hypothetical protein